MNVIFAEDKRITRFSSLFVGDCFMWDDDNINIKTGDNTYISTPKDSSAWLPFITQNNKATVRKLDATLVLRGE